MTDKEITIKLASDRKLTSKDEKTTRILEIAVKAPRKDAPKARMPLNLALVLDRSGSMSGGKLEAAKQAAAHVLDLLERGDRAAVVAFDDQIQVVAPSAPIDDAQRNHMKKAIHPLRTGGSTALHEGWLTGCREAAQFKDPKALNRCILLTDGHANVGLTDPEQIGMQARDLNERMVSTSTFGLGEGFNEHLLEAMANAGGGNYYYIESPDQIIDIFRQELIEMAEVTARDVEVNLTFDPDARLEVIGGWQVSFPQAGHARIILGSLASGRERLIYIKVNIPAGGGNQDVSVIKAAVRGMGKEAAVFEAQADISWKYVPKVEADAEPEDMEFIKRYSPVQVAHDANEALKLERQGQFDAARQTMASSLSQNYDRHSMPAPALYQRMHDRVGEKNMTEQERKEFHRRSYEDKQGKLRDPDKKPDNQ